MAITILKTINDLKKGASVASATIVKNGDGSIEFTDTDGNTVIAHSNEPLQKLFEVIDALT